MNVKVIIMDVDGVLTDGRIIVDDNGIEHKFFDVKDGHIIHIALNLGIKIAWVSGRYSRATQARADDLKIPLVLQNQHEKISSFKDVRDKFGVKNKEIAYFGDDLIDIPPMIASGFSAAPYDSVEDVKKIADYVSAKNGGRGFVRDATEYILKRMNLWDGVLAKYLLPESHI